MEEEFNLGSSAVELYGERLKNVTLTDLNCLYHYPEEGQSRRQACFCKFDISKIKIKKSFQ